MQSDIDRNEADSDVADTAIHTGAGLGTDGSDQSRVSKIVKVCFARRVGKRPHKFFKFLIVHSIQYQK